MEGSRIFTATVASSSFTSLAATVECELTPLPWGSWFMQIGTFSAAGTPPLTVNFTTTVKLPSGYSAVFAGTLKSKDGRRIPMTVRVTSEYAFTLAPLKAAGVEGGYFTLESLKFLLSPSSSVGTPVLTAADILLIGDSREDAFRSPAVAGIRTELALPAQAAPWTNGGQVWAKSALRVTHLGNGYDPSGDGFYSLNNLVTLANNFKNIVYRLGVNDVAAVGGHNWWVVAMINAHINILCSNAVRMTYGWTVGGAQIFNATQTRAVVQRTGAVTDHDATLSCTAGKWYCILAGFRLSDFPDYELWMTDGTVDRFFNNGVQGMTALATVLRYPIFYYAATNVTLTFKPANSGNGVWYLGEAYELSPKGATFVLVNETGWNDEEAGLGYAEHLLQIQHHAERSALLPWVCLKTSKVVNLTTETNSANDAGHYTDSKLMAWDIKRNLGLL